MATLDRIDPVYTPWSPSASGMATEEDDDYIGRHRNPRMRRMSLTAMFYSPKHRQHRRRAR